MKAKKVRPEHMIVNTRMFNYNYIPPTDYDGAMIEIEDKYFYKSLEIPFRHEFGMEYTQAMLFLEALGFEILGFNSEYKIIVCKEWDIQLNERAIEVAMEYWNS